MDLVIEKTNSPSLRGLLQFGLETNYSTLKNYYNESRLLPDFIFEELLEIAGLFKEDVDFDFLENNWGQKLGGRSGKRKS